MMPNHSKLEVKRNERVHDESLSDSVHERSSDSQVGGDRI